MSETPGVPAEVLEEFCCSVLGALGVPEASARTVAASLIDADLRGLDSHGVIGRLPGYADRIRQGGIVPAAQVSRVDDGDGPTGVLDGGDGFGQVAFGAALELAVDFARRYGVGLVAVRASNHVGALGYYTRLAAERGLVAHAVSGGGPRIAPWGGAEPLLATNPWSYGFPVEGRAPMVVDVSNGVVLTGAVDGPAARGEPIPPGWALDERGLPTEDGAAGSAGSLLAFGGVKGTSLTFALEVLASVMTGAAFSRQVPHIDDVGSTQHLGHLMMVLDPDRFLPGGQGPARLAELLGWVEGSRPVEGGQPVRVPGSRGEQVADQRRVSGIPLGSDRREPLDRLADDLGITPLLG